jgi:hypothetical protein
MEPIAIGVLPHGERDRRARLFDALEQLLPVRFGDGCEAASACLCFGLEAPPARLPSLSMVTDELSEAAPEVDVELGDGADSRLRGRTLGEARLGSAGLMPAEGEVIASCPTGPLWRHSGPAETVALAPLDLEPDEPLRDRLQPGRWLALLPLIQFLRTVGREAAWTPPPPRATFLFDDPNLHWTSYGFLRFAEVAAAAQEHNYHVAFATVPIDGWFAHPGAARTFRRNPERLSLLIHGNDHLARELARPAGTHQRQALLGQALRRIEAFERRSRVPVSRVMAAPHGVCSEEMARAMVEFDFEGVTISRPYPWLARPPAHWLAAPPGSGPIVGMRPGETVAGGLPVLLRTTLQHSEADLVLRAFLDQPLIVSGHHEDVSSGLGPLAHIAASVNRIGNVRWGSLAEIGRSSFESRLEAGVLHVRPYSRALSIDVPATASAVAVDPPADEPAARLLLDGVPAPFGREIPLHEGPHEIRIARRDPIDPHGVPLRRGRPWSVARRIATEGRDRIQPLIGAR